MGSGISQSRMPRLQHYLGSLAGLEIDYGLIDGEGIAGFDPCERVGQTRTGGFHGLNITHPYKQRIHPLIDRPAINGHERIGSYNTLKFEAGEITGANTDFSGFIRGYRYHRGGRGPGHVVICGAGGVGRAVTFALLALECAHISIFDLSESQAGSLASALKKEGGSASVITSEQLPATMCEADGLVNCTSLGMYKHAGNAFPADAIGGQVWAFDAVYTPLNTDFLKLCRKAGLQCISGFDLWIFQGLDAFQIFTGIEVEADKALMETALSWLD